MFQVKVGTNASRTSMVVAPDKTPKQVLAEAEVDYSTATVYLDGSALTAKEMNKSLADLGVVDSCYLIAVTKSENN